MPNFEVEQPDVGEPTSDHGVRKVVRGLVEEPDKCSRIRFYDKCPSKEPEPKFFQRFEQSPAFQLNSIILFFGIIPNPRFKSSRSYGTIGLFLRQNTTPSD